MIISGWLSKIVFHYFFINFIMDKLFIENLKKLNIVRENDKITLAVSGGADSMYLFYNFMDLKEVLDLDIIVCHLNHGIRETAKRDENFVKKVCDTHQVKFIVKHANMNDFAKENSLSSEEAGRILRYSFFRENSKDRKIMTAHNANDNAETILYNIIRGSGLNGLVGIPVENNGVYRPILNIKREDIERYLHENNLKYYNDETNFEKIYTRNKIRLDLIPNLKNYNENIVDSLLRLSENANEASHYINNEVDKNYNEALVDGNLSVEYLKKTDIFIAKEIIKRFIKENFKNSEIINRNNLNEIYDLIFKKSGTSIDLGENIISRKSYDKIIIEKISEEEKKSKELKIGKNITDFGIINLSREKLNENSTSFIKTLDYDKIKGTIYVRKRQNGDRFKPLGMTHNKKLKDYFIDRKVDRIRRDEIGIICDDEKIIYICGMDISEDVKVDKNTKNIINLEVINGWN